MRSSAGRRGSFRRHRTTGTSESTVSNAERQRFRYVTVETDDFTHAQLVVDLELGRTVCGSAAGIQWITRPITECCAVCWSDWRVRGEQPRYVSARFGSPGIHS
jgi:hypothetical protein